MRRIGQGDRVFVVLSDRYLRSPYCMFELSEVWRTSRAEGEAFLRRVRVYSLPDAQVWTRSAGRAAPHSGSGSATSWKPSSRNMAPRCWASWTSSDSG